MAHIKVFNHYLHVPFLVLGLLEYALLWLSLVAATYGVFGDIVRTDLYWNSPLFQRAFLFATVMMASAMAMGVYSARAREGMSGMAIRSLASYCLLGGGSLTILFYLLPEFYFGRSVMAIAIGIAMILILFVRILFFMIVDVSAVKRKVVVYGAGRRALELLEAMEAVEASQLGVQLVGFVRAGETAATVPESRIVDPQDDWLGFVAVNNISEIVIAADERRRDEGALLSLERLLDCKMAGVGVIEAINFYERELGRIQLEHLHPGWLLFSDGFKYSNSRDIAKRCFDLLISSVVLLLAWPFMLLTALAVYLEDGAPVLYRQVRVGRGGREFQIAKFRSMRLDAESDGKAVWASKGDSRVTRVGAFIRNTRLDELPQLYNVFRGDMSFIGPRPERPEFVADLSWEIPFYDSRHLVKPGLMGWAQLKYPYGASVKDAEEKLRYDLYYVKNQSFLLDLLILVETVEVILLGKGVH